ncbi:MAG: DNA repair protein RecN [Burkholderiales bacterium]
MLRTLSIRDFVIVDRLDLEFQTGFTVLSGETGAGKSILIDALAVVLGERAEAGLVREGCEKAEVSAEFRVAGDSPLARYLSENDLSGDAGECWLRRVIEISGRSRGYANGRAATVQQLREIGEYLVDIHGQHAHQSLMRPAAQRDLLDSVAGAVKLCAEVGQAWRIWQDLRSKRKALESDAQSIAEESRQLAWQVEELGALSFRAEDWDAMQVEYKQLEHAAGLIESAQFGLEILSEGEASVLAMVNTLRSRMAPMADIDPTLQAVLDEIEPARIQLQEVAYGLRHYRDRLEPDPQRLHEVGARIDAILTTSRKFRVDPLEIPMRLASLRQRLAELDAGSNLESLQEKESQAKQAYLGLGAKLSGMRKKAAADFSGKVTAALHRLAMAGSEFAVALETRPEGNSHGLEEVELLVAGHAGATPRPLSKVASGGELSRISLAIQTVTSKTAVVPTLIFDEVDAGIGGRVAEIVGRMLKNLGKRNQVMCVTHLPQVAAAGDQQWQVSKSDASGGVSSAVTVLDAQARVEEIARMLGGIRITDTTRRHAAEMLHQMTEDRGQQTEEKRPRKQN